MYWCHKYSTKGRFPINQILFNQKFFNTSSFTEKQCLPKPTRCQSYYKRHTNRTSLGNIMKPRDGYISYKIYRKSVFATKWSILSLISSIIDRFGLIAPTLSSKWTLQKKNSLGPISTFTSYKIPAKMTRKSTRHTKYHFRQMARVNGHWH